MLLKHLFSPIMVHLIALSYDGFVFQCIFFTCDFGEYEVLDCSILKIPVVFAHSSYLSSEAKPNFFMLEGKIMTLT